MIEKILHSPAWRLLVVMVLGFSSGLPLALTGTALQAWLTVDNVGIATIGLFSLVGLPYTFKFLWAPLMDRFEPFSFGRRRTWLFFAQLATGFALIGLSHLKPIENAQLFSLVALLIAFLSASQDVVIDAYRTDILLVPERGIGSSLSVFGYRLAMILSGGIALVWADAAAGYGWSWGHIYFIMGIVMCVLAGVTAVLVPAVPAGNVAPRSNAQNDLRGFAALCGVVLLGYLFGVYVAGPVSMQFLAAIFVTDAGGVPNPDLKKWADLLSLLLAMSLTVPAAVWASRRARFETLNVSLANFFSMPGAWAVLGLIILYKLGDAFAGSLVTTFLLKGVGFSQAEIGVVNKVIGIWLTIVGAVVGGALMVKIGLYRALLYFGILQLLSNAGFWLVAILGRDAWGGFELPAFDALIVSLKEATRVDWLLLGAISFENISGGMGTAAFVALLMALCNQKFTATQYALLSAFASVGRVWVGPLAGVVAPAMGWGPFFVLSMVAAVPGLWMLWSMRELLTQLEFGGGTLLDD